MTRQSARAGSMGLILLAAVAVALVALKHVAGLEFPRWFRLAVLLVLVTITALSTWKWWGALDEVAREAHKFAWYWGGSFGMGVAGALLILVDSQKIPVPQILPGLHSDFAIGAATVMLAQITGYLVAWAGWWWTRR
ncbi:hypothetical protein [Phenylobacterium sp.]|uniref:hypothetical protein n=1 Tax=Phenylobacterium sp. TaxID=1871053 RepID=UPI0025DA77FC|nr:hypothetical protein [Phenylobacterium sp.]